MSDIQNKYRPEGLTDCAEMVLNLTILLAVKILFPY